MASEAEKKEEVVEEVDPQSKQKGKEGKSTDKKDDKVKGDEEKGSEDDEVEEIEGEHLIKLYHARGNRPAVKLVVEDVMLTGDVPAKLDVIKGRLAALLNNIPSQEEKYSLLPIEKIVNTIQELQTLVYVVSTMKSKTITVFYYTDCVCTYELMDRKLLRKMYLCVHPKYFDNCYRELKNLGPPITTKKLSTAAHWMTESMHTEKEMYVTEEELSAVSITDDYNGMPLIMLYLLVRKSIVNLHKHTTVSLNTLVMVALLKDERNKAAYDFTGLNEAESIDEMSSLCDTTYEELSGDWRKCAKTIYKDCRRKESNPELATDLYNSMKSYKLPDLKELQLSPYNGTDEFGYLYSDQLIKGGKKKIGKSAKDKSEQADKKTGKEKKRWCDDSDSSKSDDSDDGDTNDSKSDSESSNDDDCGSNSYGQSSHSWAKGNDYGKGKGKGDYSYGRGGWNQKGRDDAYWAEKRGFKGSPTVYMQLSSGADDYDENGHLKPESVNRVVASRAMMQRLTYHFSGQWTSFKDLHDSISKKKYSIDVLRTIAENETFRNGMPIYEVDGDYLRSLPNNDT